VTADVDRDECMGAVEVARRGSVVATSGDPDEFKSMAL